MKLFGVLGFLFIFVLSCQSPSGGQVDQEPKKSAPSGASKLGKLQVHPHAGSSMKVPVRWNFSGPKGETSGLNEWVYQKLTQMRGCLTQVLGKSNGVVVRGEWKKVPGKAVVTVHELTSTGGGSKVSSCFQRDISRFKDAPRKGLTAGRFFLSIGSGTLSTKDTPFRLSFDLTGPSLGGPQKGRVFR